MPTYFKPLRRKIGVCALVMSCVLVAGWLRSFHRSDTFVLRNDKRCFSQLNSRDGRVEWARLKMISGLANSEFDLEAGVGLVSSEMVGDLGEGLGFRWEWDLCCFKVSTLPMRLYTANDCQFTIVRLPLEMGFIPLTLLSAWLLLSKPRQKQVAPIAPLS